MSAMLALHSGKKGYQYFNKDNGGNKENIEEFDIRHEFNEMKVSSKHRFIVCKVSNEKGEIVLSDLGPLSASYSDFMAVLPDNECRYAIYALDVSPTERKFIFIPWAPETATIRERMIYTGGKAFFLRGIIGINLEIAGSNKSDITEESVLERASKC